MHGEEGQGQELIGRATEAQALGEEGAGLVEHPVQLVRAHRGQATPGGMQQLVVARRGRGREGRRGGEESPLSSPPKICT